MKKKVKNTLFFKTITLFTIIILLLVVAISLISYHIIKVHHLRTLREYLSETNSTLQPSVEKFIVEQKYQELDEFVKTVGEDVSYRITVIKTDGKVIADSEEEPSLMENHRDRPEIITALQQTPGEAIRFSTSLETDMLYRAFPIISDTGQLTGVLRLSIFMDQIDSLLHTLRTRIFLVSLLTLIIAFYMIYVYLRRLTSPVRELTTAVNKISEGDFSVKVVPRRDDDIGLLANQFNDMTQNINCLIDKITHQKNTLDTVISSMEEGILLLDREGRIKEANNSFKSIVADSEVINKKYWEAIKNTQISQLINDLRHNSRHISREIAVGKAFYLGKGLVTEQGEMLILLHDISELKHIDQIKKDIVANVSHELRSPLTAVKGFVETLEDEVSERGKEFLVIIGRNIERLINIVNDLLTLSRLEQEKALEIARVNVLNVIDNITKIYRQKASVKGLLLDVKTEENLPEIHADRFKIEQLLANLLDNAIQYTDKGSITVSVTHDKHHLKIKIRDTGCGIPQNHLERIFERFYVVDKSRSRKYGGTGLGLAIVKHIVLLHNGNINIKSNAGGGTIVTILMPVNSSA